MAMLRQEVAAGRADDAFSEAIELGVALHASGLDREALGLLDELNSFVTETDVNAELWPWFYNARGMALAGVGRYEDAETDYLRMQELAQGLPTGPAARDLLATAIQNRGVVAVEAGQPERGEALLRDALPIKMELEDWVSAMDVLNALALAVAEQGELDEAERMLSSVEELAVTIGDRHRLVGAFGNRGIVRSRRGDFVGAERDFRTSLRYARSEGDTLWELLGVMNVGSSLADQGRHGEALRWYRRGARWAAEAGAAIAEVRLRRAVALMLVRTHRAHKALPEMERALELARDVGHARYVAESRADLGALHAALGNDEQARSELEPAREEFAALDDPIWQGRVLRGLAELALHRDALQEADLFWKLAVQLLEVEPEEAVEVARRAAEAWAETGDEGVAHQWLVAELDLARGVDQAPSLAWRTATAGALLNQRRATEDGLAFLTDSLDLYEQLEDERQSNRVRLDVADALSDLGRHQEALAEFERCLEFAENRSDRVVRQHALADMGEVARRSGDLRRALATLDEAVLLARRLGDEEALAHALGHLGLARAEAGDPEGARVVFNEQLRLARELRSRAAEASALGGLARLDFIAGRFKRASRRYRRAAELNATDFAVGEVEDLGGWLESTAAAGGFEELQDIGQRLVNAAQAAGLEEKGAEAFARTARVLLRAGEREGAASLYSAATCVHLSQAAAAEDFVERVSETLVHTFGLMAAHVEVDLSNDEREPFYELVLHALNEEEDGLGERLRPFLHDVRRGLEERGVFERLRADEEGPQR